MKLVFIESFKKIDKKFIYVVLFDFLFYVGLALSFVLFSKLLMWAFGSFFQIPGKLLAMSKMSEFSQIEASMDGASALLNQFKSKLGLSIVVLWLLFAAVFTLLKGPAWSFVTKQRLNRNYFKQLLKLNLLWLGVVCVICLAILWLTKPAATGIAVFLLLTVVLYLVPILYAVFDPKKGIKELFARMWYVGVEKFYYFILPWIVGQALLLLVILLVSAAAMIVFPDSAIFILFAAMILWQSWFKYYIYLVSRSIK